MIDSLLIPIYDGGVANAQKEEVRYLQLQLHTDEQALAETVVIEAIDAAQDVKEADDRLAAATSAFRVRFFCDSRLCLFFSDAS